MSAYFCVAENRKFTYGENVGNQGWLWRQWRNWESRKRWRSKANRLESPSSWRIGFVEKERIWIIQAHRAKLRFHLNGNISKIWSVVEMRLGNSKFSPGWIFCSFTVSWPQDFKECMAFPNCSQIKPGSLRFREIIHAFENLFISMYSKKGTAKMASKFIISKNIVHKELNKQTAQPWFRPEISMTPSEPSLPVVFGEFVHEFRATFHTNSKNVPMMFQRICQPVWYRWNFG